MIVADRVIRDSEILKKISNDVNWDQYSGWLKQQLIKIYSPIYESKGYQYTLICDADVVWLRETLFFTDHVHPKILLSRGGGFDKLTYRNFPSYLLGDDVFLLKTSGVAHHTMVHIPTVVDLIKSVEEQHDTSFVEAYLNSRFRQSEYQLLYSYFLINRRDRFLIGDRPFVVSGNCSLYMSANMSFCVSHHHFRDCGVRSHWEDESFLSGSRERVPNEGVNNFYKPISKCVWNTLQECEQLSDRCDYLSFTSDLGDVMRICRQIRITNIRHGLPSSCYSPATTTVLFGVAVAEQLLFLLLPIACYVRFGYSALIKSHIVLYSLLTLFLFLNSLGTLLILQPPLFIYTLLTAAVSHVVVGLGQVVRRRYINGMLSGGSFVIVMQFIRPLVCQEPPDDERLSLMLLLLAIVGLEFKKLTNARRLKLKSISY